MSETLCEGCRDKAKLQEELRRLSSSVKSKHGELRAVTDAIQAIKYRERRTLEKDRR